MLQLLHIENIAVIESAGEDGNKRIEHFGLDTEAAKLPVICDGKTMDFILYPGYKFKAMDALITNFHLPESTLVMLVSAFAGRENILNAYNEAVKEKYRFFSFGDCMLIL